MPSASIKLAATICCAIALASCAPKSMYGDTCAQYATKYCSGEMPEHQIVVELRELGISQQNDITACEKGFAEAFLLACERESDAAGVFVEAARSSEFQNGCDLGAKLKDNKITDTGVRRALQRSLLSSRSDELAWRAGFIHCSGGDEASESLYWAIRASLSE